MGEFLRELLAKKDKEPGWMRPGSLYAKTVFTWARRQQFYIQLMAQVANGVRVLESLASFEKLAREAKNPALADIMWQIGRDHGTHGHEFYEALAAWVPPDEAGIIAAGVKGQNLPAAVEQLIDTKTMLQEISSHVWQALTNPLGNGVSVIVMLLFVALYMMPEFAPFVPENRATGSVKMLFELAKFASGWESIVAGVLLLAALVAFIYALPNWTGKWRLYADRIWPFSLYREYQGYVWLMTFVMILRAGQRDTEALELQLNYAKPWLAERLRTFLQDMRSGIRLPIALTTERFDGRGFGFPSSALAGTIGQLYGFSDFPERMASVLRMWSREMRRRMQATGSAIGLVSALLMYGFIIYLMVAMFKMIGLVTPTAI